MFDVKNKRLSMLLLTALATTALAATIAGCAPQQADSNKGGASASPDSFPTGSLMALHVNGELDKTDDYSNKFCLSCHPRDVINKGNEDFAGIEGVNPHKAHLESGECLSCHSVDATSTLSCNECHDIPLPDGWQSAEQGAGPIHPLE